MKAGDASCNCNISLTGWACDRWVEDRLYALHADTCEDRQAMGFGLPGVVAAGVWGLARLGTAGASALM